MGLMMVVIFSKRKNNIFLDYVYSALKIWSIKCLFYSEFILEVNQPDLLFGIIDLKSRRKENK